MSKIDQKEYLKKYLSGDKKKPKKKKVPSSEKHRVKIIDDDVDVVKSSFAFDDELILTGEDAPQVVGIIDDRPAELKTIEDFRSSGKWKSFSKIGDDTQIKEKYLKASRNKVDLSPEGISGFNGRSRSPISRTNQAAKSDDDFSPPRKTKVTQSASRNPSSNIKSNRDSDDFSPPRKSRKYQSPSSVRSRKDDDFSPPRKSGSRNVVSSYTTRESQPQKYSDEDLSPRRKARHDSGNDYSPSRRKNDEKSNGRKQSRWGGSEKRSESERSQKEKSSRRSRSSDFSPQRRRKGNEDDRDNRHSSQYRSYGRSQGESSRSNYKRRSADLSPGKYRDDSRRKNTMTTPPRKAEDIQDFSPPRRDLTGASERREASSTREREKSKPSRTLDGKKAGLQDAKLLKEETEKFRKREDDLFQKMSADVSGKDADIVVRNRRTKSAAELQKEEERERERSKREQEKQEAYNRWGVGLKQIENYKTKIAEETHESSKPLARYSDDADLDEMLKKKERQGDPMLQYIREKNNEKHKNSNAQTLPIYKGSFPENRFNIRPGYRWDGVDRSTGYEKKWFDIQNQKKALQEEAYKYSVEDM